MVIALLEILLVSADDNGNVLLLFYSHNTLSELLNIVEGGLRINGIDEQETVT